MISPLSDSGSSLLGQLRKLFGGNHARPGDIEARKEATDRYTARAAVLWRFDHDIVERSHQGNAAIDGRHFGKQAADFKARLQHLCQEARHNRELRGPFMQKVDLAGADSLDLSSTPQVAHDFGAYSVYRDCSPCRASGQVSCSGCGGGGRRTCSGCGGMGMQHHVETRTRWNGRYNESYSVNVQRSCGVCGGGGRVVCTSCGGSGRQRCSACAGHGFFTDIAQVRAVAKPQWQVPDHQGLAADALVHALRSRGPARSRALVPFAIAGMAYDDDDHWVVHYQGPADIVELDITVLTTAYVIAAAGAKVIPIRTPAVFDQLLSAELGEARRLIGHGAKRPKLRRIRRRARRHFAHFRQLPILDRALQAVAKQKGSAQPNPGRAVHEVAQGFISADAAKLLGQAMQGVLDKVSPTHSNAAWALVGLPIALAGFVVAADQFNNMQRAGIWNIAFALLILVGLPALAMWLAAPLGWSFSALVSAIMRRRVPKEYRQRARNMAPLKTACAMVGGAALLGAAYGGAGAAHWVPSIRETAQPLARYAMAYTEPGSLVYGPLAQFARPRPAPGESGDPTYREIQEQLIARGYMNGPANGIPSYATRQAIGRYIKEQRLKSTTSPQALLAHMKKKGSNGG